MRIALGAAVALVLGCGGGSSEQPDGGALADAAGEDGAGTDVALTDAMPPPPIPNGTFPCQSPEYWPLELRPADLPFVVHYRAPEEEAKATEVLGYLETSWRYEMDQLGFRPPLDDTGVCGPDGAFDVFLWRGIDECYVAAISRNSATTWDDWFTYMVVDAWGIYAGPILDATLAHELNHACQAADDWWDAPIVFEMTSAFIEDLVFDDDNGYMAQLVDFQAHPEWSLDRDDGYETWYMYGASLYLHFLRERYFGGDAGFVADMWLGSRNGPGPNEPDFEDALDDLLTAAAGITYVDSAVEFARWRWYTGVHDDGAHFSEAALLPPDTDVAVAASIPAAGLPATANLSVMALGSAYIDLPAGDPVRITLVDSDPALGWVFQIVPGDTPGADGTLLDLSAPLVVPAGQTLVVTGLPSGSDADPDMRHDTMFSVSLTVETP